jgi:hypothetical protein
MHCVENMQEELDEAVALTKRGFKESRVKFANTNGASTFTLLMDSFD